MLPKVQTALKNHNIVRHCCSQTDDDGLQQPEQHVCRRCKQNTELALLPHSTCSFGEAAYLEVGKILLEGGLPSRAGQGLVAGVTAQGVLGLGPPGGQAHPAVHQQLPAHTSPLWTVCQGNRTNKHTEHRVHVDDNCARSKSAKLIGSVYITNAHLEL